MILFKIICFIAATIILINSIKEEDFESLYFAVLFYVVAIWINKI